MMLQHKLLQLPGGSRQAAHPVVAGISVPSAELHRYGDFCSIAVYICKLVEHTCTVPHNWLAKRNQSSQARETFGVLLAGL